MKELTSYYNDSEAGRIAASESLGKANKYLGKGILVRVRSRNHAPHPWQEHGEMVFEEALKRGRRYEFLDTVEISHVSGKPIAHWQVLSPPVFY